MATLFPDIANQAPRALLKAVDKLKLYDGQTVPSMTGTIIQRILEKIEKSIPLSKAETVFGMLNLEQFATSSKEKMVSYFERFANDESFGAIAKTINEEFVPLGTLRLLLENQRLAPKSIKHICHGLQKIGPVNSEAMFQEKILTLVRAESNLVDAISAFDVQGKNGLSNGQRRILGQWFAGPDSHLILKKNYERFWDWLKVVVLEHGQILTVANRVLEKYLDKETAWAGQLMRPDSVPARLVKDLVERGLNRSAEIGNYPAFSMLLKKYYELLDVLKSLSESVPARGQFWSHYLQYSTRIDCRQYPFGQVRVAVAIQLGQIVIVEFGPIGNAALIYDAKVFYSEMLSRVDWKDYKKVLAVGPYKDGRIIHNEGWVRKLQDFLRGHIK